MLLLLRKIKHDFWVNQQFRKYFTYAEGEIVLIIIGILIALQINNWNSETQRRDILTNYLTIIQDNIKHDLKELADVRQNGESSDDYASRWRFFSRSSGFYTMDEIEFANQTINQARAQTFTSFTSSGYQALQNSGLLERLRGKALEPLLYDYYDTVLRIQREEANHNTYVSNLWLQILARWPVGLDPWSLADPRLMPKRVFMQNQPLFEELLIHPSMQALFRRAESTSKLLLEYERLEILGQALMIMLVNNQTSNEHVSLQLKSNEIYDHRSVHGYPNVIANGQIAYHSYFPGVDDSISYEVRLNNDPGIDTRANNFKSFEKTEDQLDIHYYGGSDWAGWWYIAGTNLSDPIPKDYSQYNYLVLEIKGTIGGEIIYLNLEDAEDERDGSSTRVPLTLTDQWQIYEIPLEQFETANLSILRAIGFILTQQQPLAFSVRTLRFEKRQ